MHLVPQARVLREGQEDRAGMCSAHSRSERTQADSKSSVACVTGISRVSLIYRFDLINEFSNFSF